MGVRLLCFVVVVVVIVVVVVVVAVLLFLCRYDLCDEKITLSEDPYRVCLCVACVCV